LREPIIKRISGHLTSRKIAVAVAVTMALFHLYTGIFGTLAILKQASLHLMFVLVLVYLLFPLKRGTQRKTVPIYDWAAIILSITCLGYLSINYEYVAFERIYYVTPLLLSEKILGILLIILVLEATRRTVGYFLTLIPMVFIFYTAVGPFLPGVWNCPPTSLDLFLDLQYLTTAGIFGIPLGLSSTYLVLLIIFGALTVETGFGGFISDLAMGLFGGKRGGPAKVAVVSSAAFGTITGSGSANVAVTGNFTIPLMKQAGFKPHFAGAVEAVASTGGQIMPPIMGAAAFIMAEFLAIPYITIIKHSLIPAILYFASIFFIVDLESAKLGMTGMKKEDLPPWKDKVLTFGHMILPVIVLLYLMWIGRTIFYSVTVGNFCIIGLSMLRKATRLTPGKLINALYQGSRGTIIVAMACAVAGLMIGSIYTTGLNERFVNAVVEMSGSNLIFALLATMVTAIVLGMGMPTSAAYILMAALVIPALVKIGVMPLAAHMFGFYFACLSLITPPVAPAAYVAAGIAGSSMNKTGWTAAKIALVSYIVPYMFIYGPSLLFIGNPLRILLAFGTALVGVYGLAVAIQGYWHTHLNAAQRGMALAIALLLIKPGILTDLTGLVLIGVLFFWERATLRTRGDRKGEEEPLSGMRETQ
jgi:TRAP transporter 4TM/12TM fusion protein